MTTKLEFDYNDWNDRNDVLLSHFPIDAAAAVLVVGAELDLPASDVRRIRATTPLGPAIDGVAATLAACLEWLRRHRVDAAEVSSKVRAAKVKYAAGGNPLLRELLQKSDVTDAIYKIADGGDLERRMNPEKKSW